ncbi:MAG TPA: hypothetical protein VN884_03385 [Candidatus Sulfotelmatobacter sp.]|jgi:hypothetical protein|nr:hypothetical protein [Candidatus Sulfotelmatobacter sp.]
MSRTMPLLAMVALMGFAGLPANTQAQDSGSQSPGVAPYEVHAGTRFLVLLHDKLSTKDDKAGKQFTARTLDEIVTADGTILPAGAEIRGHVDKVLAAGKTGRAKLWLAFDDIHTRDGWAPLVAEIIDTPGIHSVRVLYQHEGEIEATTSNHQTEAEAAAAGALAGGAVGMAARNNKDAAIGAAIGAATAFMVTSGIGQELTLAENTKLELMLERPLRVGHT